MQRTQGGHQARRFTRVPLHVKLHQPAVAHSQHQRVAARRCGHPQRRIQARPPLSDFFVTQSAAVVLRRHHSAAKHKRLPLKLCHRCANQCLQTRLSLTSTLLCKSASEAFQEAGGVLQQSRAKTVIGVICKA